MAPAAPDHLQVMAGGFAKLMVSQVATRLVTFSMNLLVARQLSPEAYGLSSIQFHLITTTILLLSREGFRRGCLRIQEQKQVSSSCSTDGKGARTASVAERVLRISWLVLPLGAVVSAAVCGFVLWTAQQGAPEYREAVVAHGAAAMLELCVEPLFIVASTRLEFGRRAAIDTAAMITKCSVTLALVLLRPGLHPALVFAAAQLAFAGVVLLGYLAYGLQLMARGELRVGSWRWDGPDRQVLRLSGLFSLQAAEKLLLSEGSKIALVTLESSYNQGVYGMVANLGSLVVRLLFLPVEEAAFTAFSRAGLSAHADPAARGQLAQVLSVAVKAVSVLGLLALTFGPWYSYTLLRLVYSTRWSETEAPTVLGCYTGYLLLLAVNGITEAFVHGVLDMKALRAANAALVVFTLVHVATSMLMVKLGGAVGLVLADTVNMLLRIAYSLMFIKGYFKQVPAFRLVQLAPSNRTLLSCALTSACLAASRHLFMGQQQLAANGFMRQAALHIAVAAAALAVLLLQIYRAELTTAQQFLRLRRQAARAAGSDDRGKTE